jgi:hypothetical protein
VGLYSSAAMTVPTHIGLNKPRSALRDGMPVLIRRLVVTPPPHTSPCDDLD